jgi:hypothetical protein
MQVWFADAFSVSEIVLRSCAGARSLAFHGVPQEFPDFQLQQWKEDGDVAEKRSSWKG